MKKLSFIFYLLSFIVVSCSKNEAPINSDTTQNTIQTEEGSFLFNNYEHTHKEDISTKIKTFRSLLDEIRRGTGARFGETSVNDAVWNIEALLNASYARSDMHYQKTSQQANQVSVTLNSNQKIVNNDLLTTFESARLSLANHYSSINSNYVQPLLIDVAVNNISGNTLTLSVTSVIAEDNNTESSGPSFCYPFGTTDDWWYGEGLGKCNSQPGNSILDAADMIQNKINERYPLPTGHAYFTNIETVNINPVLDEPYSLLNFADPTPQDNYRDRKILYLRSTNSNFQTAKCIEDADMNWYYCNLWHIISNNVPPNKSFSHISFWDDEIWYQGNQILLHQGVAFYGTSNTCDVPICVPTTPICSALC